MDEYLLSLLIFTPLAGALLALFWPEQRNQDLRVLTVAVCALEVLLSLFLYFGFDKTSGGYQFRETVDWITLSLGSLGKVSVDYALAVDGISLPLVLLAAVVMLVGAVSSWNIAERRKSYFSLYLLLNGTVVGCFLAQDFFLF